MEFKNKKFEEEDIESIDLFVLCLGYEERSFFILDKIREKLKKSALMIFTIDDYTSFDEDIVKRIECECCIVEKYNGDMEVQNKIFERVSHISRDGKPKKIALDYSSMPRGWYCKIPELLEHVLNIGSELIFWYSEGEYTEQPDFYSTVGIESYRVFSGRPSFSTNRSRTHFIGVGYDAIRTQGLISILDPEEYVICAAYNPSCPDVHDSICRVNKGVIEQTSNIVSLYITDIEFMISKMKGLIKEYYYTDESDVILVPDGPKPLIFVMSMMPWIINKEGITCLHVIRNSKEVKKNNVKAKGTVIGFAAYVK